MHQSLEDQYIQLDDIEKEAAAGKKEMRDEIVALLLKQEGVHLKLSQVTKEEIDEKVFLAWCKQNLPEAVYNQLFTAVFDPNAAVHLIRAGLIDTTQMSPNWQKLSVTNRILRK
jgi:hypothetical protein